jgi:transcription factor MYB, plant
MNLRYGLFVQDKWRNLSVTAGGYGSREKARMALKKGRRVVPKLTAEPMDVDVKDMDDAHDTAIDVEPLAMAFESLPTEESPDKSVARSVDSVQIFYQNYLLSL